MTSICNEPTSVYPEAEFEGALLDLIRSILESIPGSVVVPRFGLDLAVFIPTVPASKALFIEAKSYGAQRQGGVGFGNGRGDGPQVSLLLAQDAGLTLLDRHTRWAFVDATQSIGSARYALISSSQAHAAAMGQISRGKQNNLRMSALRPHLVAWQAFAEQLRTFLLQEAPPAV